MERGRVIRENLHEALASALPNTYSDCIYVRNPCRSVWKVSSSSGSNLVTEQLSRPPIPSGHTTTYRLSRNSSSSRSAQNRACGEYLLEPSGEASAKIDNASRHVLLAFCCTVVR